MNIMEEKKDQQTIVNQNTTEWHKWRQGRIGASYAAAIMGVSPYMTKLQAWDKIVNGYKESEGDKELIFNKGHRLEDIARGKYALETFKSWEPRLCVHQEMHTLSASLDGWCEELQAVLEIKYLGREPWERLNNESIPNKRDRVPAHYFWQLCHQMIVTGASEIHFLGIIDHQVDKTLPEGETDQAALVFSAKELLPAIKDEYAPELMRFRNWVETKTPPPLSDTDAVETSDAVLLNHLDMYWTHMENEKAAKKAKDDAKAEIKKIVEGIHKTVKCRRYKMANFKAIRITKEKK